MRELSLFSNVIRKIISLLRNLKFQYYGRINKADSKCEKKTIIHKKFFHNIGRDSPHWINFMLIIISSILYVSVHIYADYY